MSGMSALCDYSSLSSNSDEEPVEVRHNNRNRLPRPDLSKVAVIDSRNEHVDDPQQHGGRVRSFPHVRGNWATFVYISCPESDFMNKLINNITSSISDIGVFKRCDNLHVSLSRTIVLKYHWINSFVDTLQSLLRNIESFELEFESVKVYCNDERTRTFIALEVKHYSYKYLVTITEKVDKALEAYNLDTFYEEPSYHMSILWIEGDKEEQVNKIIEDVLLVLQSTLESENISHYLLVDKINCKLGNKHYQFSLDY